MVSGIALNRLGAGFGLCNGWQGVVENIFYSIHRFDLDFSGLLHGCYAIRIPVFHLENIVHDLRKKPFLDIAGDGLFILSDVIGALDWLKRLKLLNWIKITDLMKKVPLFRPLAEISLSRILGGVRGVAYLFYGLHSIKKLAYDRVEGGERRQAIIDLVCAVAQVALAILVVAGVTLNPVILPLSAGAFILSCISIGHYTFRKLRG